MKKFFILILCLLLSGQVLSQYRGSGGTASFKVVSDTTSNVTSAGRTFWFGSQPWIHDGTYYKLLNYSTPNGVMEGYSYRLGRATGTNGQILSLVTGSTPDSTAWTTYTADNGALWLRNAGSGYVYPNTLTDFVGIGINAPARRLHVRNGGILVDSTNAAWIYAVSETDASSYTADAGIRFGHLAYNNTDGAWRLYKTDRYEATWDWIGINAYNFFSSKYSAGTSTFIFNNDGINMDVTIEGDTDAALFVTDGSTDRVGVGVAAPAAKLDVTATTAQLQLSYDASNKAVFATGSSGDLTITPSGGDVLVAGYLSTSQTVNQSSTPSVTASQTASTLQTGAAYTGTDVTLATTYIATKITASGAHTMGDFQVRVKESANITNTTAYFTGYIYADDGGSPSKPTGSALATGQIVRFGNITSSYQVLSLGTIYTMTNGVSYWLVVKVSSTPTGGNLIFDSAVGANMGATSDDGSTWTNTTEQLYYIVRGRTFRAMSGTSTNNLAMHGVATNGEAAYYGEGTNCPGVYGYSYNSSGVYGYSPYYYAVYGNSSANYGGYFTSSSGTGLYASSAYILGECSVGSFVDRCEVYEDSALTALASIKKKPGAEKDRGFSALDHQSLPGGIYTVKKHQVWQDKKTHARQPVGWTPPDSTAGNYEQVEYTEEGRDLSKLVSMLVKAMQEQHAINKSQAAKIKALEKRVDKLEGK